MNNPSHLYTCVSGVFCSVFFCGWMYHVLHVVHTSSRLQRMPWHRYVTFIYPFYVGIRVLSSTELLEATLLWLEIRVAVTHVPGIFGLSCVCLWWGGLCHKVSKEGDENCFSDSCSSILGRVLYPPNKCCCQTPSRFLRGSQYFAPRNTCQVADIE